MRKVACRTCRCVKSETVALSQSHADIELRERKQRCLILAGANACTLCVRRGDSCSLGRPVSNVCRTIAPAQTSRAEDASHEATGYPGDDASATTTDNPEQQELPAQSVCDELVDLNFDLMHDKQHALFHRPTFIAQQRSGQAPAFLLFAMLALGARFSTNSCFGTTEPSKRGLHWSEQSRKLFNDREHAVSLTAVQGCALLANLAFIRGDSAMEILYGAQQIRMVQLLGLPKRLSKNRIQREVELRGTLMTSTLQRAFRSPLILFPSKLCAFSNDSVISMVDNLDDGHVDFHRDWRPEAAFSSTAMFAAHGRRSI